MSKSVENLLDQTFLKGTMGEPIGSLLGTFLQHVPMERAQEAAKEIATHLSTKGFDPPEQVAAMLLGSIGGISALQMLHDSPEDVSEFLKANEGDDNGLVEGEHQAG